MKETPVASLENIYNFRQLNDNLATSGQPDEAELQEIAAAGYEVVINLGLSDAPYAIADEPAILQRHGARYEQIPVNFQAPQRADLRRFTELFNTVSRQKVFVHCAANKRVSVFLALYRILELEWREETALEDVHAIWQPDVVWQAFIDEALGNR
jgi:protein tyrosine phosphatase (PTP) superfamily phosphohydrolase (DUF442 family)